MILDSLNAFGTQSLTSGTTVGTDKIDLGDVTPRMDIASGEPMAVVFTINADATVNTDTFSFQIVSDEDDALGSPTVHVTRMVAGALLKEGAQIVLDLPIGPPEYERYLGVRYIVGSTDTLNVTAHLVPRKHVGRQAYYAKAYEV